MKKTQVGLLYKFIKQHIKITYEPIKVKHKSPCNKWLALVIILTNFEAVSP